MNSFYFALFSKATWGKRFRIILYLSIILVLLYFVGARAESSPESVYLIPISGTIDMGLSPYVKRVIDEAEKNGASAIILEINTFGGRVDAAVSIRDSLIKTKIETIAFVNMRAISAGALITLACKKVVMAPGSSIGAATPVKMSQGKETKEAGEKTVSYLRKEFSATAELNKRPKIIAEAMVDKDVEIKGLIEKGKLLTLTQEEAIKWKVADFSVKDLEKLLVKSNLGGAQIVTLPINWAEKLARFITDPMVSSLLISLGSLGLMMEFYTAGFGFSGIIGLLFLGAFFWGHTVVNLAGLEEILLFLAGIVLLGLEIFVIPGFGAAGILGILSLSAGLVLAMLGSNFTLSALTGAISHIGLSLVITVVLFVVLLRFMPKKHIKRALVLDTISSDDGIPTGVASVSIGTVGVALTTLRPAGKVSFDGLKCDVVSDGEFIPRKSQVEVKQVMGSKIVVQEITLENDVIS